MNRTSRFLLATLVDGLSAIVAFWCAYWLKLEFFPKETLITSSIVFFTTIISFWLLGIYKRIWRYASANDLIVIAKACLLSVACSSFLLFLITRLNDIPRSTLIIYLLLLACFSGGSRVTYRLIRDRSLTTIYNENKKIGVLLVGANDEAEAFIRSTSKSNSPYNVVGILDNDKEKWGRKIREINILGSIKDIQNIRNKNTIISNKLTKIIIADRNIKREEIDYLLETTSSLGLSLSRIPKLSELDPTSIESVQKIKPVELEDLLGRPETRHENKNLQQLIKNQSVLVTGAGGTIGSELCKQISEMQPKSIILSDYSEFALWSITETIFSIIDKNIVIPELLDIRDKKALDKIFIKHKPNIVLHAAALKHVPICEKHPIDAIRTNTLGTKIIAETCEKHDVSAMVLISTDKAVEPSCFMGASKRAAEIYIQNLDKESKSTSFITVRFGNVLGSTGSVVPLFQSQIEKGGPITVTDKNTTRFFMSVKEAVELVLISLEQTIKHKEKGGISVLKMGEPINIDNLAKQMIRLSGLIPEKDIQIHYTGLRKGEKIHEKLFYDDEKQTITEHPDIIIAKGRAYNLINIKQILDNIELGVQKDNSNETLENLKKLIPEFQQ